MEFGIILSLALGFAAVFLLLPRPKPFPVWAGGAVAVIALVSTALVLIRRSAGAAWVDIVLFTSFSMLAITGAGLLVTLENAARGAMAFAVVVLSTCGLFLLQAAPFLMAGTVIIYAGAIIVTFLFVIMLSQQYCQSSADSRSREPLLACLAGALLLYVLLATTRDRYDTGGLDRVLSASAKLNDAKMVQPAFFSEVRPQVESLRVNATTRRVLCDALDDLEAVSEKKDVTTEQMQASLQRLIAQLKQARREAGDIPPPPGLNRSTFAGGDTAGQMPSRNVAALGRTLFSDYLLAVEMGGTLLLVATIGAIAITNRHAARSAA